MKEAQQERICTHLTYILEGLERQLARPPHTYVELELQERAADVGAIVALEVVCELLPTEIQPIVKRLVQVRETIWARKPTLKEE
jgi:hypothetical protein